MRIVKLFAWSALFAFVANSAKAVVPDAGWTMPEPQGLVFTTFTVDVNDPYSHVFYLYNPAAKMFFASGNDWNTKASARIFGYAVWLQKATEDGAPNNTYELWNYVDNYEIDMHEEHNVFFDGSYCWVDHVWQSGYTWRYVVEGDFVRFSAVTNPNQFLGWDGTYIDSDDASSACSSVLKMLDPAAEGGSVNWRAVTEASYKAFVENAEAYEAYKNGAKTYIASISLRKALEEADALGVPRSDALAVYANTASSSMQLKSATTALNATITAFKNLKSALDEAVAKGFTATAKYETLLASSTATKEQFENALADLTAAVIEWGKTNATFANPVDMTGLITNPNFDNASSAGWLGTSPNMVGSGSHGPANVAEVYNRTFDTYQNLEGLPAGVYALGAKTAWRGSWTDMENELEPAARIYATVGETEVYTPFNNIWAYKNTTPLTSGWTSFGTAASENWEVHDDITYYSPNDPSAFRLYEEKGYYDTKVVFAVTDGTARIGAKNPQLTGTGDNWSLFDTFTLTYYGSDADAAQFYLDETLKNYGERVIPGGVVYTGSYLVDYNAAVKQPAAVSTIADANAALDRISEAKEALEKNIQLWKDWQGKVDEAYRNYVSNPDFNGLVAMNALKDCYRNSGAISNAHRLTNEELETEIARIEELIQAVKDESLSGDVADGRDMTQFIKNPGFDADKDINSGKAEGWTIDVGTGGNLTRGPLGQSNKEMMENALGYMNYCFEAWHRYNWDVWQEVEGLPKGMYELSVQGFVRCEIGSYNRGDDINPDYPSPIYLYMNSAKAQFPSVYTESPADKGHDFTIVESWTQEYVNDKPYPNSMGGAAQCFGWDMYKMKAYGLIAKQGDKFRIGVKMEGDQDWWCIWDNFKLTYRKPTVDIVKPALEEELGKYDLSQAMSSEAYEQLSKVMKDAKAAIETNDGEQMFDALVAMYDVSDVVIPSVSQFAELKQAVGTLSQAISTTVDQTLREKGETLYRQVSTSIENHTITAAALSGLLTKINRLVNRIYNPDIQGVPGDLNGDDEVDVTDVVELIDMVLAGTYDPAGDINGDGEVDVTDVVELIDMVLAGE